MIGNPYEEIQLAHKSITKEEQAGHLKALDETLCSLMQSHGKQNLPSVERLLSQLHELQEAAGRQPTPCAIPESLVAEVKRLAEAPIVKGSMDKPPGGRRRCRTLFDYVE